MLLRSGSSKQFRVAKTNELIAVSLSCFWRVDECYEAFSVNLIDWYNASFDVAMEEGDSDHEVATLARDIWFRWHICFFESSFIFKFFDLLSKSQLNLENLGTFITSWSTIYTRLRRKGREKMWYFTLVPCLWEKILEVGQWSPNCQRPTYSRSLIAYLLVWW